VIVRKTLVLTRALAGKTGIFGGVQFTRGEVDVEMGLTEFEGLFKYLSRSYQVEIKEDGKRAADTGGAEREVPDVQGEVPEDGRPPKEATDDSDGDADPAGGGAGVRAEGDGQKRPQPVKPWAPKQGKDFESPDKKKKKR
jgi:hypothetical protein